MAQHNMEDLRIENGIVQGVYGENKEYFSKILGNYKCKFRPSGQDWSMFAQTCVEEILTVDVGGGQGLYDDQLSSDSSNPRTQNSIGPLEIISRYIMNSDRTAHDLSNDLQELTQNLIKEAVESERNEALKKILLWINKIADGEKFKNFGRGAGASGTEDEGFWMNNSMMARACMKDDFEMVYTFRSNNFDLRPITTETCHPEEKQKNVIRSNKTRGYQFGDLIRGRVEEEQPNILLEYKYFAARSMPAYMLANYLHHINPNPEGSDGIQTNKRDTMRTTASPIPDPISAAFFNAHIARKKRHEVLENANKYRAVENRCKKFIETMLDLCKDSEEANTFIASEKYIDHYFDTKLRCKVGLPRIVIALKDNYMDFVSHDFIQQILRDSWYTNEKTGEYCRVNSFHWLRWIFHLLLVMVAMPFAAALYPLSLFFNRSEEEDGDRSQDRAERGQLEKYWDKFFFFYNMPYNRFLTQMLSNAYFCIVILCVIINPIDDPKSVDVDWYDYLIVVFAIAFLLRDIKERWNYGASALFRSSYLFYYNIILRRRYNFTDLIIKQSSRKA